MKITYINHSGFLIETENCYYVLITTKARCRGLTKQGSRRLLQSLSPRPFQPENL